MGCFKRTASKHVYYLGWNRSPAQVGCMRQVLGPGALGRPRGIGWRGRWEGDSGWGTHVNPWLFHFNVWQNPLQLKKKRKKKINLKNLCLVLNSDYIYIFPIPSTKTSLKHLLNYFESEKVKVLLAQSCLTLRDPIDCILLGSSVRGILQARVLKWVTILFSRGSFQPRDQTQTSCTAGKLIS